MRGGLDAFGPLVYSVMAEAAPNKLEEYCFDDVVIDTVSGVLTVDNPEEIPGTKTL